MGVYRTRVILWVCMVNCFLSMVSFWNQWEMVRLMRQMVVDYDSVREFVPPEFAYGEWYHPLYLSDYLDDRGEWRCGHCLITYSLSDCGEMFVLVEADGDGLVPVMCARCFARFLEEFLYDGGRVYIIRRYHSGVCDVLGLYCVEARVPLEADVPGLYCVQCGHLIEPSDGDRFDLLYLGSDYASALAAVLGGEELCASCACWDALFVALPDDSAPEYVASFCLLAS